MFNISEGLAYPESTLITKNFRANIVDEIQLYEVDSKHAKLGGDNSGKKKKMTQSVILRF